MREGGKETIERACRKEGARGRKYQRIECIQKMEVIE